MGLYRDSYLSALARGEYPTMARTTADKTPATNGQTPEITPTNNMPTADSNLPAPQDMFMTVQEMYRYNQEYHDKKPEQDYPSGRPPLLFNKGLLRVPFVAVSGWMFRTQPASTGMYNGELTTFPERDVAQLYVRILDGDPNDETTWHLLTPQLATLTGGYLLNQLRGLSESEVVHAGIWTLYRNENMKKTPDGKRPVMLRRWTKELGNAYSEEQDEPSPFEDSGHVPYAALAKLGYGRTQLEERFGLAWSIMSRWNKEQWDWALNQLTNSLYQPNPPKTGF